MILGTAKKEDESYANANCTHRCMCGSNAAVVTVHEAQNMKDIRLLVIDIIQAPFLYKLYCQYMQNRLFVLRQTKITVPLLLILLENKKLKISHYIYLLHPRP